MSDLNSYLERHPQIKSGMYIPLNSAIVVAVYIASKADHHPMPNTLTELYTAVVNISIRRHLEESWIEKVRRVCLQIISLFPVGCMEILLGL